VQDLQSHFRSMEMKYAPKSNYMSHQKHINEKMRAILIDWLVEVHLKFKLVPETLYLTIHVLDRFLGKQQVARNKLQLVGVTALLIASKYEEIYPPEIRDLVYITDRAYNKQEIISMEGNMLSALNFRISCPTSFVFLERYLKVGKADAKQTHTARFITERMHQEYGMLKYKPSMIAACSLNLARRALCVPAWNSTLEKHSVYSEASMDSCMREISTLMNTSSNLQAVKKKYSSSKYERVASVAVPQL
jgi:cyclin B